SSRRSPVSSQHDCPLFVSPPRPRCSPLFPYTTLFRSSSVSGTHRLISFLFLPSTSRANATFSHTVLFGSSRKSWNTQPICLRRRSEEHTSELQSRENLVCRLLLEKKKTEQ